MKKILCTIVALTAAIFAFAQGYTPVNEKSAVKFSINNFGLAVGGSFTGIAGNINYNPTELSSCLFNVSINAGTVNTDNSARDKHLKKDDYFDVQKYPTLTFVSTKVTPSTKAGVMYIFGNLTIKGVTKAISFPFTATPKDDGMLFAGSFKLNRRNFNVGSGSLILSDNLTVNLSVFAKKN